MTTEILHWAQALWARGDAIAKWRSHYEKLRDELAAPERASGARIEVAERKLREASDAYSRQPDEAHRLALEQATAAVPFEKERHYRSFGEQHMSSTWRLEKLLNIDLAERAIHEAEAELQRRQEEAVAIAEKLGREAGFDPVEVLRLVDEAFARRAACLESAAQSVSNARKRRADPSYSIEPSRVSAAYGQLEAALKA